MKRVVITGLGVVAPNGTGVHNFLESIKHGVSGIRRDPELESCDFQSMISGIPDLSGVDQLNYFSRIENRFVFSEAIRYSVIAAKEAWEDANLPVYADDFIDWDTGAVIGAGSIAMDPTMLSQMRLIYDQKDVRRLGSKVTEQRMNNGPAVYVSGKLGLGNWVASNSSACSTGTEAIIMGYDWIRTGRAKRMVCGSTEGQGSGSWAGFESMRILVRNSNDAPEKASRPMSANASGFVASTGAGMLILEEYESAMERGAPIYAEIIGGYSNSGAQRRGGTMVAPNPEGVQRCISSTIEMSGIEPKHIDLISGHLTGTMADPLEIENWKTVLNLPGKEFPYINSLKSMIGHGLGAAGSIEMVACCLQMKHKFVHPSINAEPIHPKIADMIDVGSIPSKEAIMTDLTYIAKTSFAFGDTNSCLIIKNLEN
ncbi:MAG: beta-ketoacyl-[acyl-carrier-protein] synthase family protein [Bacteroidota bacterium]